MNSKSTSTVPADMPVPVDFYREESYGNVESVGYMMRRIVTMVGQQVERQLEVSDLTNAQWVPLFKLHIGCATTVAELARECELDAGAMTRLLDRIEAKGLCKRVRSSQDRRVVNLELTPAGHDAAKTIPAVLSRVQNANLAGFSATEFVLLNDFLSRIMQNALAIEANVSATASATATVPNAGSNPSQFSS